ncbi:hypothetical protein FQR65_LT13326 [Abscondita terminalis]|nr:hypothetical protein FQR65_LT13326 [Abscondita terminalis]
MVANSSASLKTPNCRTRLQNKFDESENFHESRSQIDTRRIIRTGVEKICKTFNNIRNSIGMFSQRFRLSTKRRRILEEGPTTPVCSTPNTLTRIMLGRTPTKLYSPFCIDSPYKKKNTHFIN